VAEFSGLGQVWFVVSPRNPFKPEGELLADYHRRELLIRAVGDYAKFRVSSVEFKLPKPSYTIDTLDFLSGEYPDTEFTVIMGEDQLPKFHEWKESDRILADYRILVYPRNEGDRDALRVTRDTETQTKSDAGFPSGDLTHHASRVTRHVLLDHQSVTLVKAPLMEVSGTFIRESIRTGKDVRFFMPEQAWKYLDEMNFYKQGPEVNP
jgi:nicotinate-nucleotide adenylyltransferase